MKLSELLPLLNHIADGYLPDKDLTICIPIYGMNTIGADPTSIVRNISVGFDWDKGKLMLWTEDKLTKLTEKEAKP
jgi:hypothetical protein